MADVGGKSGLAAVRGEMSKLTWTGLIGACVMALCCFTPVLPVVLGGLGLTGLLSVVYTDAVLLPLLVGFVALTVFGVWRAKTGR